MDASLLKGDYVAVYKVVARAGSFIGRDETVAYCNDFFFVLFLHCKEGGLMLLLRREELAVLRSLTLLTL